MFYAGELELRPPGAPTTEWRRLREGSAVREPWATLLRSDRPLIC